MITKNKRLHSVVICLTHRPNDKSHNQKKNNVSTLEKIKMRTKIQKLRFILMPVY